MDVSDMDLVFYIAGFVVTVLVLLFASFSVKVVEQDTVVGVLRGGKYHRDLGAGMNLIIPILEKTLEPLNVEAISQHTTIVEEVKTADNVFISLELSVNFTLSEKGIYNVYYKSNDVNRLIDSHLADVTRTALLRVSSDEVHDKFNDLKVQVLNPINSALSKYGYDAEDVFIESIKMSDTLKNAMEGSALARHETLALREIGKRDLARAEIEAEIKAVAELKAAEVKLKIKQLEGQGLQAIQNAVATGFSELIKTLQATGYDDSMKNFLTLQYINALRAIGTNSEAYTFFIPEGPFGEESSNQDR